MKVTTTLFVFLICSAAFQTMGAGELPPRAALPVETADIPPGLEDVFGHSTWRGAYVVWAELQKNANLDPPPLGSPLEDVLEAGDLIVALGDAPIGNTESLLAALTGYRPGVIVRVKILRRGSSETFRLRTREEPPFIYLPATVCPTVPDSTKGAVWFFFGLGALAGAELATPFGECPTPIPPCRRFALVKQKDSATRVSSLGSMFEIKGDWRRHTHLTRESCLEEESRLEKAAAAGLAPAAG